MTHTAKLVIAFAVYLLTLIGVNLFMGYQLGYDTAKAECKPIKTEIPLKNMTHKQQVKVIRLSMKDKGAVR